MRKFFILFFVFCSFFIYADDNLSDINLLEPNTGVADLSFLSDLEKEVIKELNLARTNPVKYAEYLKEYRKYYKGMYLEIPGRVRIITNEGVKAVDEAINALLSYSALPALKASKGISMGSKDHVKDQGPKGSVGHNGSDGSSPFDRMNRYGKWDIYAGENIDYGNNVAREIVFSLIIDDGVAGRGHRKNIFNKQFGVVGVSCGNHKVYNYMCVMGFAGKFTEK